MSSRFTKVIVVKSGTSGVAPTGMALAYAILRQGKVMMDAPDRDTYLVERTMFFELLKLADNDQIAGPYLAHHVQRLLDEESRRYRELQEG